MNLETTLGSSRRSSELELRHLETECTMTGCMKIHPLSSVVPLASDNARILGPRNAKSSLSFVAV